MRELPSTARRDDTAPLIRAVMDTARAFKARHREASARGFAGQAPRGTGIVPRSPTSTSRLDSAGARTGSYLLCVAG
jgi:hypothetical protein